MTPSANDQAYVTAISSALVSARRTLTALPGFPGELPDDLATAYAVQSRSIREWGQPVVGWKVGGIPPQFQEKFGAKRVAGPVFANGVLRCNAGDTLDMGAYPGGFAAMEAEYIVVLKDEFTLPDRDVTLADMADLVADVHIGIELASSPMKLVNALGPTSIISDFGNNAGCVIGPKIDNPTTTDFSKYTVSVTIDGDTVGSKPAGTGEDGPFGAVIFLINHLRAQGRDVPGGLFVSSGAVSGVHETEIGTHSVVKFEGLGTINIKLVPLTSDPSK